MPDPESRAAVGHGLAVAEANAIGAMSERRHGSALTLLSCFPGRAMGLVRKEDAMIPITCFFPTDGETRRHAHELARPEDERTPKE